MAGRKVSDFRGRLAYEDQNAVTQRIMQKRQNIKPTGVGMGSAGGRPVIETEIKGTQERVRAKKDAWRQGHPS